MNFNIPPPPFERKIWHYDRANTPLLKRSITKPLKTMLNRKNRFFKTYKRHGYKLEDKVKLDNFRKECQEAVENAKLTFLENWERN